MYDCDLRIVTGLHFSAVVLQIRSPRPALDSDSDADTGWDPGPEVSGSLHFDGGNCVNRICLWDLSSAPVDLPVGVYINGSGWARFTPQLVYVFSTGLLGIVAN